MVPTWPCPPKVSSRAPKKLDPAAEAEPGHCSHLQPHKDAQVWARAAGPRGPRRASLGAWIWASLAVSLRLWNSEASPHFLKNVKFLSWPMLSLRPCARL